jgi:hypothetical protein
MRFSEELAMKHDLRARGTDLPKENAVEAIEEVVSLLRHAVTRTHTHNPSACSPCEQIEKALS